MKRRQIEAVQIDMTPMLDIVFIMLIFFIVAAVFLDEKAIALTSPPEDAPQPINPLPALSVYIDDQNKISLEGETITAVSVGDRIMRLVGDKGITTIQLSVSEEAHLNSAVTVFDDLKLRGLTVSFRVVEAQK